MAFVGSLYSRPRIVTVCIRALMEKLEGRISQAELEERMRGLQDKQIDFYPQITQIPQIKPQRRSHV